jgi:sulfur carrier protein ThiS
MKEVTMLRKWVLAVVTAVVLLGSLAGVAAAQGPDDPEGTDLVARIAENLGMTRQELLEALLTGKTLQEVAEEQGAEPRRWSLRPLRGRGAAGPVEPLPPEVRVEILAELLEMEPQALREALEAGQTVAELLEKAGLSAEVAAAHVKAALIERIEQAAEEGKLAEERAATAIERLEASAFIERWLAGERPVQRRMVPPGLATDVVAEALAMEPEELKQVLRAGQTVPGLLAEAGLEPEDVAADIKARMIARIETAVEQGELDAERARVAVERLEGSDVVERWLAGEMPDRLSPQTGAALGRRVFNWLRRHPVAARTAHRLLERWFPGLRHDLAPVE